MKLIYVSYRKSVQHGSIEGVHDTNHPSIGGDENQFPVITEFESSPVADTIKPHVEGGKGTLSTGRSHLLKETQDDKIKHSTQRDLNLTLSKARRSYSLMACDSTPAANISPSGSKEHTGFPSGLVKP